MDNALLFAVARQSSPIVGDAQSLVPWWSITKAVLAAAVLRLVDQGALRLDDHFEDWPFTIRQLLQHTAGLTTYRGQPYHDAVTKGDPPWPVDELLERCEARRLLFPPGQGWAYSNIGYLFVRQLIEQVTKSELAPALQRLVFAPMGSETARVALTSDDVAATAWGNPANYDPGWVYHGLVIGTPVDAVAFLRHLWFGDLLSSAALSAMQAAYSLGGPLPARPWLDTAYGLGLMKGTVREAGRAIGHSGVGPNSVSALYVFPELDGSPIAAAFARGTDEGVVERDVVRRALTIA